MIMKRTTKLILALLFSLFLLLLSGCGFMVIEVTPTPTPQTPTETPLPPTNTPSKTATASKTLVPSKTPVPTSTPTPNIPLSADGPWLVYQRNYFQIIGGDAGATSEEFTILNQDGSGKKMIEPFPCDLTDFLMSEEGAANYMIENNRGTIFLFRPVQASGCLVQRSFLGSNTAFSRQEKGGLLASIYRADEDTSPELIVYELPAGTVRARLPLIECPEDETACQDNKSGLFDDIGRWRWSPNGRYLAFTAVRNSISSDLYVLDSRDGSVRQLTSGPDWVGGIWWSPDGSQIVMEEIVIPWNDELKREDYFYVSGVYPSSLWSVWVSDNQLRRLYSIEEGGGCCTYGSAYHIDGPWMWLDDKRFLIYEGASGNYDEGPARNLRLVDTSSGETRMLVDFSFYDIDLDEVHDVFALSLPYSMDEEYEQGVYLVSLKNSTVRHIDLIANIHWDEKTGLFVTTNSCKDDPEKYSAFNYLGELRCVSQPSEPTPPATTASYPAPDGKSEVSVQEGLWLKAEGQDAVRVSQETASNVIWCPDSSCFFFFVKQEDHTSQLYHVSLPDLTLKLVDEGIQNVDDYWWLQKEDSQP